MQKIEAGTITILVTTLHRLRAASALPLAATGGGCSVRDLYLALRGNGDGGRVRPCSFAWMRATCRHGCHT